MAKLVTIVKGGYRIEGTNYIIPAANLIPFGVQHDFPNNDTLTYTNFKRRGVKENEDSIRKNAILYMDSMNAPFGELCFEFKVSPQPTFFGFSHNKMINYRRALIQLYVENKPEQVS